MWELDCEEGWALKNRCFWTVVLEKTLESHLDSREIQPVHLKGDQFWIYTGRTDAETPIIWPPDAKSWLICKDPDAGKDFGQEEKGRTEDEMVRWHHQLNGHGFGWTPGVGDEQAVVHGVAKSWTWLSDWSELKYKNSWHSGINETETHFFFYWWCRSFDKWLWPSSFLYSWVGLNLFHINYGFCHMACSDWLISSNFDVRRNWKDVCTLVFALSYYQQLSKSELTQGWECS